MTDRICGAAGAVGIIVALTLTTALAAFARYLDDHTADMLR